MNRDRGWRHFPDIASLDRETLSGILARAIARKRARATHRWRGVPDADAPLRGCVLALLFEQPSTRTRISFDMAMRQLGGQSVVLSRNDLQLSRGESVEDTARVLSCYADAIMVRTQDGARLAMMQSHAAVPVINGLTKQGHPCQIMADLMTLTEARGSVEGLRIAWVGDGNNVANSYIEAAARFGFSLALACPDTLPPCAESLARARREGADITISASPLSAVRDADCVVTDSWLSMSDEAEMRAQRHEILAPFHVNAQLMKAARADAIFLHCLPAHRGEEVSSSVIDGAQSRAFEAAENRLHVQKAILAWCLGAE